jgi:hypothetical protein
MAIAHLAAKNGIYVKLLDEIIIGWFSSKGAAQLNLV